MDPVRLGGLMPLSEEWFHQQKKLLKEGGIDKTSAANAANDVYTPSEAAMVHQEAQEAPPTSEEIFMSNAMNEIAQLDPNSETFVPDGTSALVDSALSQVFGEKIAQNPGYPQMHNKVTTEILSKPEFREIIEDYLYKIVSFEYTKQTNNFEEQ